MKSLKFGICEPGIRHKSCHPPKNIASRFRMVQDAGVFDYIDVTPAPNEVNEYEKCAQRFDIPILAGSRNYILGKEENELFDNLRIGAHLGSVVHNTQVFMDHEDGHLISNEEVAQIYIEAYDLGHKVGCIPTFEIHVNMWSEKFSRVSEVAELVQKQGIPFGITLDHSHVIFKIDNPSELAVFGVDKEVKSGELVLDPFAEDNVFTQWINQGLVKHAHARSVSPNNPKNIVAAHPDINKLRSSLHPKSVQGRGIQYPFKQPNVGEWHAPWQESDLAPWKQVVRMLMTYHANNDESELQTISTEFIPFTDYGEGAGYSLLEQNAACAEWLRTTWQQLYNH